MSWLSFCHGVWEGTGRIASCLPPPPFLFIWDFPILKLFRCVLNLGHLLSFVFPSHKITVLLSRQFVSLLVFFTELIRFIFHKKRSKIEKKKIMWKDYSFPFADKKQCSQIQFSYKLIIRKQNYFPNLFGETHSPAFRTICIADLQKDTEHSLCQVLHGEFLVSKSFQQCTPIQPWKWFHFLFPWNWSDN